MKKRIIYFSLLIIAIILISTSYFSYAFLTNKDELHGKLNMVVGTLDYKLESSDLKNNKITVNANTMEILNINLKSLNTIKSKYELYYKASDDNDLIIGYGDDSEVAGIVDANSSKKITVIIRNISDTNKEIEFGVQGGFINNELVLGSNKTTLYSYCNLNQEYSFDYTGSEQEFITPCTGQYKIEAWGASGYEVSYQVEPGLGAYTSGIIEINSNQKLYIYVGDTRSYNSGGVGEASGGGASDIRLTGGKWSLFSSLKDRIMVAAGGGGGFYEPNTSKRSPGHGGGLIGYDADAYYINSYLLAGGYSGHGATQQSVGISGNIELTHQSYKDLNYTIIEGGFGLASYGIDMNSHFYSSGGGGGYYGGGHGVHPGSTWSGGGGGSSFISGHNGCDAIKEESTEDNIIHTGQPNHYSGLVFTDTIMIDGAGYNWTTEKGDYVGMPTHDGTGIMTGNKGNGYAKITYIAN